MNAITDYHAKYYALELTKRGVSDSMQKLVHTQLDLNLHPVEVALFAFRSPLSMRTPQPQFGGGHHRRG